MAFQWLLVERFGHLDIIEPSLQEKIGTLVTQEIQHKSKIMPIRPPIFVKGGTLVAITKGVPISGWWDFGLSNKNNNNQLPKRLSAYKGNIEEESFSFADCPYDYFIEDLKKAYYKKIKKERCGPKEIVFSGTQKFNDQDNISITEHQKDLEISKSPNPALNNCYKKVLGERRYQEVIFLGSQKPKDQEKISIIECQKNPDYWSAESFALGYNTPDYYYDIFDGSKIEDCVSNPNPIFTHEITDFSQIRKLQRWGLTPQGYLKNHTYIFLKNKGHSGNRVIIDKPVPVYAPVDSHLIMQTRYRLQGLKEVQWRLMFQVGCEIVYRFDHLDTPSDRILKHLGNILIDKSQVSAPNVAVQPPLKITAGELIAHTKGTPQGGTWDFGVVDISKNNELPKRLIKYENKPAGRQYKYAACPYDYYPDKIKKKYLKKMKRKKCNPKEIKNK